MKFLRLSASLLTLSVMLAACGGGGGGGSTPPVPNPSSNPGGGGTPTPAPTASPTTAPTATPTPGGVPVNSGLTVSAEENFVNGDMNWYTSGTASWASSAGGTSTAPNGSAAVDGSSCQQVTEGTGYPQDKFSQHVFLGIYNGNSWEAVPQALGMVNPVAPTQGTPSHPSNTYEVENNQCEYNVHTHDYSGLVHIEDESFAQSNTFMPSYANLQTLFDVWGAQLGATGITAGASMLTGPVAVYVGTPSSTDSSGNDLVTSYSAFTGAANTLQFSKHMAIWIVVGNIPTGGLPQVKFVISN